MAVDCQKRFHLEIRLVDLRLQELRYMMNFLNYVENAREQAVRVCPSVITWIINTKCLRSSAPLILLLLGRHSYVLSCERNAT